MLSLVRHLWRARGERQRASALAAELHGHTIDCTGLTVDLGALADALIANGRAPDVVALFANPAIHIARAVRRLASGKGGVPGLIHFECERCGRCYPGTELWLARESNGFASSTEGRCPAGHVLPALGNEVVVQ